MGGLYFEWGQGLGKKHNKEEVGRGGGVFTRVPEGIIRNGFALLTIMATQDSRSRIILHWRNPPPDISARQLLDIMIVTSAANS